MKLAFTVGILVGLFLTATPVSALAQNRPKPAAEKMAPVQTNASSSVQKAKPPVAGPFNGKLAAVNVTAKTITVGKRTFQITAATKLLKAGQPATLADAVVGEKCSGYVKPTEDGKWFATTVNFGPKGETKGALKR